MAEVNVRPYTTIDLNVDISDYIDTIEVDIDIHVIGDAISQGDVDETEVLELLDHENVVAFCENIDGSDFPDEFVINLVKERNDLVKLALGGRETIQEAAKSLLDRFYRLTIGVDQWQEGDAGRTYVARALVRHLLANDELRLAVHEAVGEHYAGTALPSLGPDEEAAETETAENETAVAEAAN